MKKSSLLVASLLALTTILFAQKEVRIQISSPEGDMEEVLEVLPGKYQADPVGSLDPGSSDIELGDEKGKGENPQLSGFCFTDVPVGNARTIVSAHIEFELDEIKSTDTCAFNIWVEDTDNASLFGTASFDLSSRPKSIDSIAWNIPVGDFVSINEKYTTSDITSLVQSTVNRTGWNRGNSMAFYIKGDGVRGVESFDGEPSAAATLVITYMMTAADSAQAVLDSIQAVNDSIMAAKIDSTINTVSGTLVEADYTIPSWTLFKRKEMIARVANDSASLAQFEAYVDSLVSKEMPYTVVMSINGEPTTRMGFAWFTNMGIAAGEVQIVEGTVIDSAAFEAATKASFTAETVNIENLNYNNSRNNLSDLAGIADDTKKSYTSHKALATGLTANTTYSYRVGKAGSWSEVGTFTTAKASKDDFSFFYIADTQAMNDDYFSVSQRTVKTAYETVPDAQFCLMTGDLVESSGSGNSEWEWEQWFELMQPVWKNVPVAPVCGNHDKSANKNLTYHFNTDTVSFDQQMSTTPGAVYSYVYGDALFIAMSTEDWSKAGYLDSLKAYVKAEVEAHPEVKWKIAFYHKTMYTGSNSHQSDSDGRTVREAFIPLFDEVGIDMAFQGHDHIYEVIGVTKDFALVDGAVSAVDSVSEGGVRENMTGKEGGVYNVQNGTLFFLNNSAGKKKYEPRTEEQMIAAEGSTGITNYWGLFTGKFGQTGEPTFSDVTVTTDTIFVTTYTVDAAGVATEYDSFKVVKSDDTSAANDAELVNVQVYPNPSNTVVNVSGIEVDKMALYNLDGQMVTMTSANQVNVSALEKGIYMLKVLSGDKMFVEQVIVK